jgi:MFS family permease
MLFGPLVDQLAALGVLWLILGFGYSLTQTPTGRLLRRSAQPEDRPAIFAAQFALSHACWLVTYPLAGWAGATFGLDATFLILAGLAALGLVAALGIWPANLEDDIPHTHPDLPPDHPHMLAHGTAAHHHPIVIDDLHRVWPFQTRLMG